MTNATRFRRMALASFSFAVAGAACAATIHVDSTKIDDSGDGLEWATAKKTIQAAIDLAGENDTVLVAAGTYPITAALAIAGANGETKDIELRGATGNPADVVVDAQGQCPCLVSLDKSQIIVSSMTFANGRSATENVAGGITATDKSMVTNCIVRACYHGVTDTMVTGGGILLTTDKGNPNASAGNWPSSRRYLPQVVDTVVENCAVYTEGSDTLIARGGGAYLAYHNSRRLTVRDCVVTNYSGASGAAQTQGGGAYLIAGLHEQDVFLRNALENPLTSKDFLGAGGGVYLMGSATDRRCRLTDSLVSENSSRGCGGGVGMGRLSTVEGCSVTSNRLSHVVRSDQYQIGGAGIYVMEYDTLVANTLVAENHSTNAANVVTFSGAITVNDATNAVICDCVIRDNVLQRAGAFSLISAGDLVVSNCVISGNTALLEVSAIRFLTNQRDLAKCGTGLIVDCQILSNSNPRVEALTNGGGILQYGGAYANKAGYYGVPLIVRNCLFAGNRATNGSRGWGVRATLGALGTPLCDELLKFDHCTFAKNVNENNYKHFVAYHTANAAEHVAFDGCVIWENRCSEGGGLAYVTTDYQGASFTHCYSDVTNVSFVVTAENGNLGGGDVGFVDADNLDFRLTKDSCLVDKGGAFADWMGTGQRNSTQDAGAGVVIGTVGTYGVTVVRKQTNPRRFGVASDIGCCEYWQAPGFVLLYR